MTDKTVFWEVFVEDDYDYDDYDGEYDDYDDDEIAEAKKWRDDLRKFLFINFESWRGMCLPGIRRLYGHFRWFWWKIRYVLFDNLENDDSTEGMIEEKVQEMTKKLLKMKV